MFKIYGGATKFKQWTQDNKLIMDELPIGADVMFYNDPSEDDPLITEVYEIRDEEDNVFRVCDVPNILLTETNRIKVRIPKVVKGLYGNLYKAAGRNEMIFEVESAEKPDDYVYEKTKMNTIDPSRLPEGYPYKQMSRVTLVDNEYIRIDHNTFDGSASWGFDLIEGETYDVTFNNRAFHPIATKNDEGNLALTCYDEGFEVLDIIQIRQNNYYLTGISSGNCTIIGPAETIHPIAAEFLPTSVPAIKSASVGQVPKVAAVDENGVPTKWEAGEAKSYSEESWTFTLEDGGTVTKKVAVGE